MSGDPDAESVEIVLVEDSAVEISLTLNVFKKANISNGVHILRNPAELMEFLLRSGSFSGHPALPLTTLVLLSLNLKGTHGLDLLRKIKGDERTKSLPVIMLTSSQEERGIMESYKIGANACIVKPFDLPKFVEAVADLRLGWLLISPPNDGEDT